LVAAHLVRVQSKLMLHLLRGIDLNLRSGCGHRGSFCSSLTQGSNSNSS
jgi:hypothetical protein